MKRIMVTGGAGFIGSHVVEAFINAGHEVAVLDNLSTGKRGNVPPQVKLFQGDVTDAGFVSKTFAEFEPEVVDHHAAQISVNRSVREPRFDAEQNILGSINLLEAAARHGVTRFIFASTGGALYGDAPRIPSPEDTPIVPLAPYGIAKSSIEHYIRFFAHEYGLEAVVLRYANVYGPRQDPFGEAGVVAIFSLRSIKGEACAIYGTGEQTRDFVHVKDIASANLSALTGNTGTYNIGSGTETSIKALFAEFKNINPALEVEHKEARPGEVYRSALDSARARQILGWIPQTSLSRGIGETYEWFKGLAG